MNIHKLLCSKEFREKLANHINDKCPELIECDHNNHIHDVIKISEYNNPDGTGFSDHSKIDRPHTFSLIIGCKDKENMSCMGLWRITKESKLDDIIETSKIGGGWGYKLSEGLIYPNIGLKVKSVITNYIRKEKLKRING